jgi:hypothetical protein
MGAKMKSSRKVCAILAIAAMITILLTILFTQTVNPIVTQMSTQEKALNAMSDILGLNMTRYTAKLYNNFSYSSVNYGGLPEDDIAYTLAANDSELSVVVRFVNNSLMYLDFYGLNNSAPIYYTQQLSDDPIVATKTILSRLHTLTNSPIIGEMQGIIEKTTDVITANKTVGNLKCQVLVNTMRIDENLTSTSTSIYFMYTLNGAGSPKSISVHFQNGVLKTIVNTWDIFSIGNENITVTREQAIEIARAHASNSTSNLLNFTSARPVTAELRMVAREKLTLYPSWYVEIPLDYPGSSVNGWQEGIWADTGESSGGHPTFGSMSDSAR